MLNDESQRKEFFTAYVAAEPSIRRLLRLLVHDHRLLEDVCQTVALRLWERFDSYDRSRPFGVWARGVATNVVNELRRSDRRSAHILPQNGVETLAEAYERNGCNSAELAEQLEALKICLESLPGRCRDLINKRYYESLPVDELARQTGRSEAATYKAVERSLEKLAVCVRRRLALVATGH